MNETFSADWLSIRARTTPDALALIVEERTLSYGDLDRLVDATADSLQMELSPGERIACLLPNSLDFVRIIHAAARLGAILVPLNTRLTTGEIAWQLEQADCTVLVYTDDTAEKATTSGSNAVRLLHCSDLTSGNPSAVLETRPSRIEQVQGIIFTSGTSGTPKGAQLTFANHFHSAVASAFRIGVQPDDRWLCCLPLYHVGGQAIILRSCLYGTAVILQEGFDAERVTGAIANGGATLVSLVPTMLRRLIAQPGSIEPPPTLRLILLGGAAAPPDLITECHELGLPVATTYGLTEAASQVATMLPDDVVRKPGSVGRPLFGTQVAIFDRDGQALSPGEIGEISINGPTVMAGYNGDEAGTAAALQGGWLRSGDMGYLDEEGDLWVMQRREDLIVSGGENVYPAEVEAVLLGHPQVAEACVVGLDDSEWGQRVAAAVVPRPGPAPSPAELIAYCRDLLAGYKLPRTIHIVNNLPKTASGKIQRQSLKAQLSAGPPAKSQQD